MRQVRGNTLCFNGNPPRGGFPSLVRGFTLVELIAAMIIIGILAVVVAPRWGGGSGFEERGFRDRVATALRYAQKSAIASRRTVCATFSASPAQVSFRQSTANAAADCSAGSDLVGPEGGSLVVTASGSVAFASLPADIIFDAGGRPAAAATIAISGLDASLDITVAAETGYVR